MVGFRRRGAQVDGSIDDAQRLFGPLLRVGPRRLRYRIGQDQQEIVKSTNDLLLFFGSQRRREGGESPFVALSARSEHSESRPGRLARGLDCAGGVENAEPCIKEASFISGVEEATKSRSGFLPCLLLRFLGLVVRV